MLAGAAQMSETQRPRGSAWKGQLDRILTLLEGQENRRREEDRKVRSRSPLRRRPDLRPTEPSHPPPARAMTRLDLETRLRRELAATTSRGNFDGAGACVDGLTNEALDLCISVCQRETNHDTILWVVAPSLSPDHQQKNGIRLSVRYRGYIRSSWASVPS